MVIMQGDQYGIPVQIETESGIANKSTFADVEVVIGKLTKTLSKGELTYNDGLQAFLFPITQQESFDLRSVAQNVQIRVKTHTGEVIGIPMDGITVAESESKAVL